MTNTQTVFDNEGAFAVAVQQARTASQAYYGPDGRSVLTDAQFDDLAQRLAEAKATHPTWDDRGVLSQVAGGVFGVGERVHATPMLSMDKTTRTDDVVAFVGSVPGLVDCEAKIDGVAISARFADGALVELVTRGDGRTGELVDPNTRLDGLPQTIKLTGKVEVRGEVFMTKGQFTANNAARKATGMEPFANARNATAGTLRRQNKTYESALSFAAYDANGDTFDNVDEYGQRMKALTSWGVSTVRDLLDDLLPRPTGGSADVTEWIGQLGDLRDQLRFDIDGAVVKAESYPVRSAMGAGSRAPKWALAYKYPAPQVESVLRDIQVNVGRTGRMSLTAIIDPVSLNQSTVARATLHNPDFVAEQSLGLGSNVVVELRGDVIPRVSAALNTDSNRPSPWQPPRTHEACGEEWFVEGAVWRCVSPQCSTASRILWATARESLDVEGVGPEIAAALVESGLVKDLADLFTVTTEQIATTPMGDRQQLIGHARAQKITDGVQAAKNQPLSRVVTSLGIRTLGRTFGRRLARHFVTLDAIRAADERAFQQVEAVGPEKAKLFVEGFQNLSDVLDRLVAEGISTTAETAPGGTQRPLDGQRVVVTGSMVGTALAGLNRTQVQELIEAAGGKAAGSVSGSTTLLVCAGTGSSKQKKAIKLGVPIQTPDEFAGTVADYLA